MPSWDSHNHFDKKLGTDSAVLRQGDLEKDTVSSWVSFDQLAREQLYVFCEHSINCLSFSLKSGS